MVVVGAGIGGLAAALDLAVAGFAVTVVERAATPGGKMRRLQVGGQDLDAGPTVLTMRWVFEELFARANLSLSEALTLEPASLLARHAWSAHERLDLYADPQRTADAIGAFSGPAEARGFLAFAERAKRIYQTLERPFIRMPCDSVQTLMKSVGLRGMGGLARISPFDTLWKALSEHFRDPRLRQLFGRYATYCGSSPFQAPATLMLVAHVEQQGVWLVRGGMHRLAQALAQAGQLRGVTLRYETEVSEVLVEQGRAAGVCLSDGERIEADAVVLNADVSTVASGRLGRKAAGSLPRLPKPEDRSLSALTWALVASADGFPLVRHNVFFSADYAAEFADLFQRSVLPRAPTVYVCAQDRDASGGRSALGPERLLCLVNAPPTGDRHAFAVNEIKPCETHTFQLLERCGLKLERSPEQSLLTTPKDFERLFPGTGGALYGPASHGWTASFNRPQAHTRLPGLVLAGGSTHPGPGVPMAALSGRLAALRIIGEQRRRG